MIKKMASLILIFLTITFVGGCNTETYNDVEINSGLAFFDQDTLISYADIRYQKGYSIALEYHPIDDIEYTFEQSIYLWGNDLRNEIRHHLRSIIENLMTLKQKKLNVQFCLDSDFIICINQNELYRSEASRSNGLLALLFPKEFSIELDQFIHKLHVMFIVLESSIHTNEYEVIHLNVKMKNHLEVQYQRDAYLPNILYGINDFDNLIAFLDANYLETETIYSHTPHELLDNETYMGEMDAGDYIWFQFHATAHTTYVFTLETHISACIEMYDIWSKEAIFIENLVEQSFVMFETEMIEHGIMFVKVSNSDESENGSFQIIVEPAS